MHSTRSHLLYTKWKVTLIAAGPRTILTSSTGPVCPCYNDFRVSSPAYARVLCNEKKKEGGGRGDGEGANTGTSISIETPSPIVNVSLEEGGSFLPPCSKREWDRVRDRARKMLWRELARNGRSEREREGGGREWQQALVHYGQCFLNCC